MRAKLRCWISLMLALAPWLPATLFPSITTANPFDRLNHIIVIFEENWSFDGLYGQFPGANGHANADNAITQLQNNGTPYRLLPVSDARLPQNLPVRPFDLAQYIPPDQTTEDLPHNFFGQQAQINGGAMNKFVAYADNGLVLSYYDATTLPEGQLAREFILGDNFFHAAFGGSFLNHQWLICSCTPRWPNAPGDLVGDVVTADGYAVNTSFTVNAPHPSGYAPDRLVPNQTAPTIGDLLSAQGISWAWYSGGWNDALAGSADPLFQYHHQPFAYFANYADGTAAKATHLRDEQDFLAALTGNSLPAVSFVKALGVDNEHPGYATLVRGQQHTADLVSAVRSSPYWADTAIIITYDENGGRWDHVAPPAGDRWGPGTRVPLIVISPFARRGYVDHTRYDTTSILKTIETRWGLTALGTRDAAANDLRNAFDFTGAAPGASLPTQSACPAGARTFPEVPGRCLTGRFRDYWDAHGGLAINGFPLTNEFEERLEDGKTYRVQYFERLRMELHPENAPPYDVLLGQFGRRILGTKYPGWEKSFP
ncbi:MAG: alkaline phosphatase family protein [Thermomicrobiales bacterium]